MSGIQLSKADLAKFYGVSLPTISAWVGKGCPFISKGGQGKKWVFCSSDVAKWREDMATQHALGDMSKVDIDEARRRKTVAEATIMELDLAHRRGELIEIEYIAALVGDEYGNVRAKILALPTKIAPLLLGVASLAEARGIIEAGIIETLEELTADEIYSTAVTDSEDDESEAGESKAAA